MPVLALGIGALVPATAHFAVHPPTVFPPGANLPSGQLGNRGQLSSVDSPRNLAPISHHRWLLCGGWASTDRKAYESESHRLSPHNSTAHADETGRPGTPLLLGSLSTGRARQGPRSISEEFFGSWLLILYLSVFVKPNQYSQILRRQCCLGRTGTPPSLPWKPLDWTCRPPAPVQNVRTRDGSATLPIAICHFSLQVAAA